MRVADEQCNQNRWETDLHICHPHDHAINHPTYITCHKTQSDAYEHRQNDTRKTYQQ
jgi:hypothetical protein